MRQPNTTSETREPRAAVTADGSWFGAPVTTGEVMVARG